MLDFSLAFSMLTASGHAFALGSWALPSLELSPTVLLRAGSATAKLLAIIPTGTRVYLPALPADPPDAVEGALRLLRRENAGLLAVPHIPATRVASTAALEHQLGAWQRASGDGVREVLIVRGDLNAHEAASASAAEHEATKSSVAFAAAASAAAAKGASSVSTTSGRLPRGTLEWRPAVSRSGEPAQDRRAEGRSNASALSTQHASPGGHRGGTCANRACGPGD